MAIAYYTLDTETSGLRLGFHELLEISIIRHSDKAQITKIIKAIHPENASLDALQITNKTMDDLKKGISLIEAINAINAFFEEDGLTPAHRCIVAHNDKFDRKFLYEAWERKNKIFPAELWVDTIAISKKAAAEAGFMKKGEKKPKFNLKAACDLFGIKKIDKYHSAKYDSRNTYFLFKYFEDNKIDFLDLINRYPQSKEENEEEIDT